MRTLNITFASIEFSILPLSFKCGTIGPHLISSAMFLVILAIAIISDIIIEPEKRIVNRENMDFGSTSVPQ